ncbi:hypothetical protein XENTR_v10018454 [Xenopus tropicalis]|nr:hypothetical protein XENTR_v10018454 [Xenopus tropicalis]
MGVRYYTRYWICICWDKIFQNRIGKPKDCSISLIQYTRDNQRDVILQAWKLVFMNLSLEVLKSEVFDFFHSSTSGSSVPQARQKVYISSGLVKLPSL